MNIEVRKVRAQDYVKVSELVCRNFMEVNIKDYPKEEMIALSKRHTPGYVEKMAEAANMYVACSDGQVVGVGAIHSYWGKMDESILRMIFVAPEQHGKGIGKKIVLQLEEDECFKRAKRVEVAASITARDFYLNLGYAYKDGNSVLSDEGHYKLEKKRG